MKSRPPKGPNPVLDNNPGGLSPTRETRLSDGIRVSLANAVFRLMGQRAWQGCGPPVLGLDIPAYLMMLLLLLKSSIFWCRCALLTQTAATLSNRICHLPQLFLRDSSVSLGFRKGTLLIAKAEMESLRRHSFHSSSILPQYWVTAFYSK